MTSQSLEPVRVTLAYRLGELTLFERTLEGLADRRHFTRQEVAAGLPDLPPDRAQSPFYFFPCYPVVEPPPVLVRRDGWLFYSPYSFRNYYIDLSRYDSFDHYLAKFSAKSRSTLRRKIKRFADGNGGVLRWCVKRTPDEMTEFLQLALPLAARTYQERLLGAGLPRSAEFADKLRREAAAGRALGYLLFANEEPVAYVLCFCRDGIATYDYVGFDPSAQTMSPGTVLQYLMLESMFSERRIAIFDFTEGEGLQKEFFATDHRVCSKTYVLRATFSNRLAIRAHRGLDALSSLIGRVLNAMGLKAGLRKLVRRVA